VFTLLMRPSAAVAPLGVLLPAWQRDQRSEAYDDFSNPTTWAALTGVSGARIQRQGCWKRMSVVLGYQVKRGAPPRGAAQGPRAEKDPSRPPQKEKRRLSEEKRRLSIGPARCHPTPKPMCCEAGRENRSTTESSGQDGPTAPPK